MRSSRVPRAAITAERSVNSCGGMGLRAIPGVAEPAFVHAPVAGPKGRVGGIDAILPDHCGRGRRSHASCLCQPQSWGSSRDADAQVFQVSKARAPVSGAGCCCCALAGMAKAQRTTAMAAAAAELAEIPDMTRAGHIAGRPPALRETCPRCSHNAPLGTAAEIGQVVIGRQRCELVLDLLQEPERFGEGGRQRGGPGAVMTPPDAKRRHSSR